MKITVNPPSNVFPHATPRFPNMAVATIGIAAPKIVLTNALEDKAEPDVSG
jgi:hypothetical protein